MDRIKYEGSQHQRRGCVQWGIQGGPLFLYQTKARRAEKVFFETGLPPIYLRVWMTGLPRYLKVWGPFLESPGNFTGKKSNIQIEI